MTTTIDDLPTTGGLTWRPLGPDLLDTWHTLHSALLSADGGTEVLTVDDLRDELEPDWIDLTTDSRVALDAEGNAVAFGLVQVRPGDVTLLRASSWGGVHPDWRGKGIGRALLAWQLARGEAIIAARRAELGPSTPAGALVIDEQGDDGATATLLTEAGFHPSRYFHVMRRDLADPIPMFKIKADVRIVSFAEGVAEDPALDDAVRLAHNEAFVDHWGFQPWSADTWAQWETGHRWFRGEWSFVALATDGQVAGYALSSGFEPEWKELGWTQGWTAKLGVREAWRGTGLAKALLARSMQAFKEGGMQYAGLDVDSDNPTGAYGLYESLGYELRHRATHWTKDL